MELLRIMRKLNTTWKTLPILHSTKNKHFQLGNTDNVGTAFNNSIDYGKQLPHIKAPFTQENTCKAQPRVSQILMFINFFSHIMVQLSYGRLYSTFSHLSQEAITKRTYSMRILHCGLSKNKNVVNSNSGNVFKNTSVFK